MATVLIYQALLEAIKEGSRAYYTWQKSREKARLEACKDAAEKFIQVTLGDGEFNNLTEERKKQLQNHFARRFFAYN